MPQAQPVVSALLSSFPIRITTRCVQSGQTLVGQPPFRDTPSQETDT